MSTTHSTLNQEPSSNSTTPPSEATLADEMVNPTMSRISGSQRVQFIQPSTISHFHTQETNENETSTDYESSANEDDGISAFNMEKYEDAESALLAYSRTNKIEKLKGLLDAKSRGEITLDLNHKGTQKQNYSWSALHLACYFGHLQVVELLLSKKEFREEIDVNIRNSSGDTPLHKATFTNRVHIVQLLLSNGASVFIKNCDDVLCKQLTSDKHIYKMLEASEQSDINLLKQNMFKAVDNGDLRKLQEYFQDYDSLRDFPEAALIADEAFDCEQSRQTNMNKNDKSTIPSADFVNDMTDERGNTLLHLAAMRGSKAICIYLLEQGFDPYRKNNLGQTCIEISSYQLRQLFMSVKPADSQLKKLSRERVTRFEGPLLRKVRILGWKQMYVVLENGVILLFNNRRDSMNKSRRGYKYLESAICEPDANEVGMFTLRFSDNSRATFLVSSNHLNYYTSFNLSIGDSNRPSACSQVELIRQKWLDSLRDHIVYSTDFIRKGLKFDDEEDYESTNYDGSSLASLNHLLPIDTIKSFIQEARAHYSILERHADSLCNLTRSITSSSQQAMTNSFDSSYTQQRTGWLAQQGTPPPPPPSEFDSRSLVSTSTNTGSTGNRLLSFIRSARQPRTTNLSNDEEGGPSSLSRQQLAQLNSSLTQARSSKQTNEFIQDNWPCLLFHLRLLMESTENTKTSMGQALALLEHQEHLRQNRIQDQEERCRVLEDSLQALARDHHELEKSLSVSQIYHSAPRSMSMSTDLNEYHDAFEDFDDEKTMTPNSSLDSDEELDKRIEEVMNDEKMTLVDGRVTEVINPGNEELSMDEDYDVESNCSALTVETITDQFLSAADLSQFTDKETPAQMSAYSSQKNRTRLPARMIPRDQVSIWSILKNCIGKELSKITMPVVFNEPLTMLQRACEGLQYTNYLVMADLSDNPIERMEYISAFIVATLSGNALRIVKPFNPLLYETFEIEHDLEDGTKVRGLSQQVSHHPPITAAHAESDHFSYIGVINPKIKFWGRSIEISHDGVCRIHLKRHNESYTFKAVPCSIHNIIVGKLWFEHHGSLDIRCSETNLQANLVFKQAGWFSNDLHRFDGFIGSGVDSKNPKKLRFIYGKWTDYIKSVEYLTYENYMKENQQKLFRIPDNPDQDEGNLREKVNNLNLSDSPTSVNNNSIPSKEQQQFHASSSKSGDKKGYTKSVSTHSLDIPNSRTLWRLSTPFFSEYYNFSLFTMKLNELTPDLERTLPKTDSRFRPDVRKLEEGDLDGAASEKQRLEEKQREIRSRDKRFKDPSPDMLWFELESSPNMKEKFYVYKGGYWESRCNTEKFPCLF